MPRGATGSSSSSSFRGAEQSLHIMRQVKSYFNVGMDHVLEVAADMAEYGKGDQGQARQLSQVMLNYLQMERDVESFMSAANNIIAQGAEDAEEGGLVKRLKREVTEQSRSNNDAALKEHDRYLELQQKLWDSQHPDALPSSLGVAAGPVDEEDEVEMTQEQVNTRCPYTGQEMVDPVRNVICKHTYDRAGIYQHMKQRGKKAMCPVAGCTNNKPITSRDLEENKQMKRYIQSQKKRPHPSSSASASAAAAATISIASTSADSL